MRSYFRNHPQGSWGGPYLYHAYATLTLPHALKSVRLVWALYGLLVVAQLLPLPPPYTTRYHAA